ncbi:MAG: DUF3100 domain-containing protein [Clostridia bacterium]|nr:DUF3100 domain-containing protein [Clostridia bacterium]
MKKNNMMYPTLLERIKTEWIIYALAFVFILIADSIGQIKIPVWKGTFIIFPIFYALFLGILSGPNTLKIIDDKRVKAASKLVGVAILPFIAKLGINAGANIEKVISAGPALLLQEFGNLGTIVLAMPLALLLGLKRESIGAAHSINRETNLALIQDMYGADSPEGQGSLSVYITGGMVGTIYFGFMASMVAATGLFHPYALGMASGVGAGIMMSSAVAALSEVMPEFASEISAMASASETISGIDGIYMAIFIGLPLCNWLYNKLEPTLGRVTKAGREAAERIGK